MCLEFVNQRLLELKLKLDIPPAVSQREELEEVVGLIECQPVKLSPGEGHVDVLGPLGPVHYEHPGDGRVHRSVQRHVELPVVNSDRDWGPLTAEACKIIRFRTNYFVVVVNDKRMLLGKDP